MSRIVKHPEERRNEIIIAAQELFLTKGYESTTINDIIQKIGVAKGTFYHYFKSKDEIADAVIQNAIDKSVKSFKQINENSQSNAIEKFSNITRFFCDEATKHYGSGVMTYLHYDENMTLHQRMKVGMIKEYTPIIADVVKQGIHEGVFTTNFPNQITEFLLIGLHFMLDPSFFSCTREQFISKLDAVDEIYEKMLGTKKGEIPSIKSYLINLY